MYLHSALQVWSHPLWAHTEKWAEWIREVCKHPLLLYKEMQLVSPTGPVFVPGVAGERLQAKTVERHVRTQAREIAGMQLLSQLLCRCAAACKIRKCIEENTNMSVKDKVVWFFLLCLQMIQMDKALSNWFSHMICWYLIPGILPAMFSHLGLKVGNEWYVLHGVQTCFSPNYKVCIVPLLL